MGHEELTIDQMLKGGGRFWELGRVALDALKAVGGHAGDASQLWSVEFQMLIAEVLIGRAKIVAKTPEEIVRTERRPWQERMAAVSQIEDEDRLKVVATDLALDNLLRRKAFRHIKDEAFVAEWALSGEGDDTDERLLTMNDQNRLFRIAMDSEIPHVALWATKRLMQLSRELTCTVAAIHVKHHGPNTFRLGIRIAELTDDITLLTHIRVDRRTHPDVLEAVRMRVEKLREAGN